MKGWKLLELAPEIRSIAKWIQPTRKNTVSVHIAMMMLPVRCRYKDQPVPLHEVDESAFDRHVGQLVRLRYETKLIGNRSNHQPRAENSDGQGGFGLPDFCLEPGKSSPQKMCESIATGNESNQFGQNHQGRTACFDP
jgi:hypothetical protein